MLHLPPFPTWDSLHPLIIHFPIVLLLLSPLLLLISVAVSPSKARPYMLVALLVLLLGTASLFVAVSTGEAAGELAERGGAINGVLESHEELASETRIIFSILSTILLGIVALPIALRRKDSRLFSTLLPVTFLALYSVGAVFLVNTAHQGGRLVHEFGVHAMLPVSGIDSDTSTHAATEATKGDKD